jgi:hypothetical protein
MRRVVVVDGSSKHQRRRVELVSRRKLKEVFLMAKKVTRPITIDGNRRSPTTDGLKSRNYPRKLRINRNKVPQLMFLMMGLEIYKKITKVKPILRRKKVGPAIRKRGTILNLVIPRLLTVHLILCLIVEVGLLVLHR